MHPHKDILNRNYSQFMCNGNVMVQFAKQKQHSKMLKAEIIAAFTTAFNQSLFCVTSLISTTSSLSQTGENYFLLIKGSTILWLSL